jgi:hypothetical protein
MSREGKRNSLGIKARKRNKGKKILTLSLRKGERGGQLTG